MTPNLDFNSPDDFTAWLPQIRSDVCGSSHIMPHAEHVMKRFWESGARAYLRWLEEMAARKALVSVWITSS